LISSALSKIPFEFKSILNYVAEELFFSLQFEQTHKILFFRLPFKIFKKSRKNHTEKKGEFPLQKQAFSS
jgi:hypothetical protein